MREIPEGLAHTPKRPRRKKVFGKSPKRRGELAEIAFIHKAASYGFGVAKPYGDSFQYDFILDSGERLWRVQVKSTYATGKRTYRIDACWRSTRTPIPYSPDDIDILVAYIVSEEVWYVVPVLAFAPRMCLYFRPGENTTSAPYEQFREAWCLMACRKEDPFDNLNVRPHCEHSPLDFAHPIPARGCPKDAATHSDPLPSAGG